MGQLLYNNVLYKKRHSENTTYNITIADTHTYAYHIRAHMFIKPTTGTGDHLRGQVWLSTAALLFQDGTTVVGTWRFSYLTQQEYMLVIGMPLSLPHTALTSITGYIASGVGGKGAVGNGPPFA